MYCSETIRIFLNSWLIRRGLSSPPCRFVSPLQLQHAAPRSDLVCGPGADSWARQGVSSASFSLNNGFLVFCAKWRQVLILYLASPWYPPEPIIVLFFCSPRYRHTCRCAKPFVVQRVRITQLAKLVNSINHSIGRTHSECICTDSIEGNEYAYQPAKCRGMRLSSSH